MPETNDHKQQQSNSFKTTASSSETGTNTHQNHEFPSSKWLKLNVGGKLFITTISTLQKEPNSMLARMFSQDNSLINPSDIDENGAYLIDRSSQYFEPIINYLRHGRLIYDTNLNIEGILEEARFFGIESLTSQLESQLDITQNVSIDHIPLTRRDVIKALIQTSYISEIRFQGVNLAGADLRKLDFRNINFKVNFQNKYLCMYICINSDSFFFFHSTLVYNDVIYRMQI